MVERKQGLVWIDLEMTGLDGVGEGERIGPRDVVAGDHQLGLEVHRQGFGIATIYVWEVFDI